ncbi:hypothetical protein ACWDSJ_27910 [Nocardia sp. NPDC003482]
MDSSNDSARPHTGPSTPARVAKNRRDDRSIAAVLDRALFVAPYVLISADNRSPERVAHLDEARQALARGQAASIGGRLRPGVLGADIDPAEADAILGDVCAEIQVAWCVQRGLPYMVRRSGRPGGMHVIAVARRRTDLDDWAKLCTRLTRQLGVRIDDRTGKVLRLLSAPHRCGHTAPVLGGTLTPRAALEARPFTAHRPRPTSTRTASWATPGERDLSRSGQEYGAACAMARAGYRAERAWLHDVFLDGKSGEQGELWWRRYIWMPAVTTVAAEQGIDEEAAWKLAQRAAPIGSRTLGRDGWQGLWDRAIKEAATDRPRRWRIHNTVDSTETLTRIGAFRRGFERAVASTPQLQRCRPRRRHSIAAILHALAPVLIKRNGSISCRELSEKTHLDTKTVRAGLAALLEAEIVVRTHTYSGGANDCDAYGIGSAAQAFIDAASKENSPTSCSTPPPLGRCNPRLLRQRHHLDRSRWRQRCSLLARLPAYSKLAFSDHPAARTLRSLWAQRQWWKSLTDTEKASHREKRRKILRNLDFADFSSWMVWLAHRERLCEAADRITDGAALAGDYALVAHAPVTLHRGMKDQHWRTGGRRPAGPDRQGELYVLRETQIDRGLASAGV